MRSCWLVLMCACGVPEEAVSPDAAIPLSHAPTLAAQVRELGAIELAPVRTGQGARVDKYRFAFAGIPVRGAGIRVRVHADGTDEVIDPILVAADIDASPAVHVDGATLAFEASLVDDTPPFRRLEKLRLTWRFSAGKYVKVIDADTGALIREEAAASHATGYGAFGVYENLPTQPVSGGECLADLTRGENIVNTDPCGALGLGIHTFIVLPADATNSAVTIRALDSDGMFGNGFWASTRAQAAGEEGRTTAADAHHAIGRAYDFYNQVLGRAKLGANNRVYIDVNADNLGDASWTYAHDLVSVGRQPGNTSGALVPVANVEYLTHEYTHGVLFDEIGSPTSSNQFGAIHEGVGDIFGVLADAWQGTGVVAPARWEWADGLFLGPPRYFDRPSRTPGHWDELPAAGDGTLTSGATTVHQAGGVVRRAFYILANGLAPGASMHVPDGLEGLGVAEAATILWRAIRDGISNGAQPTFLDLRNAMVVEATEIDGFCGPQKKAVEDAWAAVNVGTKANRTGPTLTFTVTKAGLSARIDVRVFSPLWLPTATGRFDSTQLAIPLEYASSPFTTPFYCGGSTPCYWGSVYVPYGGPGTHEVEVTATSCGNPTTVAKKIDFDAPTALSIVDQNTWRSSIRRFTLTAYDGVDTLTYRLDIDTASATGSFTSGTLKEVIMDLSQVLPAGGTTTLRLSVRDPHGNEATYTQPYYIDRTPPSQCFTNNDNLLGGGGFRIEAAGCELETRLEILDVWINGAPWWWADRNHTSGDRMMTQRGSNPACQQFVKDFPATQYGFYNIDVRCVDQWGNEARRIRDWPYTPPPTITTSVTTNATAGTFTITATASSLYAGIEWIDFRPAGSSTILERDTCSPTSTTCTRSYTGSQPAGSTRSYTVEARDTAAREPEVTVTVVMPMPPPPSSTPYNEVENNDSHRTPNLPPRTTNQLRGTAHFNDSDGVCAQTSADFWGSCNPYTQPWNCKSACGDYFAFDLDPGTTLVADYLIQACFNFTWGTVLNVGETSVNVTSEIVNNRRRITNNTSTRRRVWLAVAKSLNAPACTSSAQVQYAWNITVPPL